MNRIIFGPFTPKHQEPLDKKPRPKSGYNLFIKDQMDVVKGSGHFENQREVMSALGSKWKSLDPAAKEQYQRQASQQNATAIAPPPEPKSPEPSRDVEILHTKKKKKHDESSILEGGQGVESSKKKKVPYSKM